MHISIVMKTLGILLMTFSATMLPPLGISIVFSDGAAPLFWQSFYLTCLSGLVCWLMFYRTRKEMRTRDGFLVTVLFYLALGTFGSLPFMPVTGSNLSFVDALFESFSGLTTTGATVITGLDDLPKSILFYRQQLQWLGGMGIIVLAVAILPMLGVGGMQLYRAETPGPVKDSKLTPRIKQTALALWSIYVGLTFICCMAFWIAGMSFFDAICHSFSTVAIGGFSTYDASIGYFDSPLIESITVIFMIIAGVNFSLHFIAMKEGSIAHYLVDPEVRVYLSILAIVSLITGITLYYSGIFDATGAMRYGVFAAVSVLTTTGFATEPFSSWPGFIPMLIFYGAFVGACAGSTGGGMKVVRVMLLSKQALREIYRLIHPNAVFPIKQSRKPISNDIIEAIWGFFSIYVVIVIISTLLLMSTGLDLLTAFSSVGASINNLGPGLGDVADHYGDISDFAKLVMCVLMVLGRLEIFTLLVLFTPMFWQK